MFYFYRIIRRLFKIEFSEYSVSKLILDLKPNIRNSRFINRLCGRVFRLFNYYFFPEKKQADYFEYSDYSAKKPNILPT